MSQFIFNFLIVIIAIAMMRKASTPSRKHMKKVSAIN